MASFQVYQDNKENPLVMPSKDGNSKPALAGGNVKQPLAVIGGTAMGKTVGVAQAASRSNFPVRNSNVPPQHAPVAISNKLALRDVGNLKAKDDADIKQPATVVPVEQFKQFSVYEDNSESVVEKPQTTKATAGVILELQKVQQQQQRERQNDVKFEKTLHKEYAEYALDGTPMSVTDVLSPMSIDHSNLSTASSLHDDSNIKDIADKNLHNTSDDVINDKDNDELVALNQRNKLAPRNDRERFFEVTEYQRDILVYFRESEKKHRPKSHYMRRQTDITHTMRTILVDWLVEVAEEYQLDTETLYLAVSYIDRFLSQMSVVRSKLQLVGTAAMYVASKYEEIYPPDIGEFVFITDDTYSKAQVLRMEQIILKILAFDLCTPTPYVYINTYAVLADIPDKIRYLSLYISELSLLEAEPYLKFLPSIISASALALARYILGVRIWSTELEDITSYRLNDLREVLLYLATTHMEAHKMAQQAIVDKYAKERYKSVALIEPTQMNEQIFEQILHRHYQEVDKMNEQKQPVAVITTAEVAKKSVTVTEAAKGF